MQLEGLESVQTRNEFVKLKLIEMKLVTSFRIARSSF